MVEEVLTPGEEALFDKLMERIKAREVEGRQIDNLVLELLAAYEEAKYRMELPGFRGSVAAALRKGPIRRFLAGKKLFA